MDLRNELSESLRKGEGEKEAPPPSPMERTMESRSASAPSSDFRNSGFLSSPGKPFLAEMRYPLLSQTTE